MRLDDSPWGYNKQNWASSLPFWRKEGHKSNTVYSNKNQEQCCEGIVTGAERGTEEPHLVWERCSCWDLKDEVKLTRRWSEVWEGAIRRRSPGRKEYRVLVELKKDPHSWSRENKTLTRDYEVSSLFKMSILFFSVCIFMPWNFCLFVWMNLFTIKDLNNIYLILCVCVWSNDLSTHSQSLFCISLISQLQMLS